MITLIQGPIATGKSTIAKALKAALNKQDIRVAIIDDCTVLRSPTARHIADIAASVRASMALGDVILISENPRLRQRFEKAGIHIQRTIILHRIE